MIKEVPDGTILDGHILFIYKFPDLQRHLQIAIGIFFFYGWGVGEYVSKETDYLHSLCDKNTGYLATPIAFFSEIRKLLRPQKEYGYMYQTIGASLRAYFKNNKIYAVGDVESKKWFCQYAENFTCDAEPVCKPGSIKCCLDWDDFIISE